MRSKRGSHHFLIFLALIVPHVRCSVQYGPSILSLVQSPSLKVIPDTSSEPKRYLQNLILLGTFPNYATVLPLVDERTWAKSEEIRRLLGAESLNYAGPFVVRPPANHGMMVVIQELQIPAINTFNRSLIVVDDDGNIVECFSKFLFQIEGRSPVEVCGRTDDQDKYRPSALDGVGPRSFVVPVGKSITVWFTYRDEAIDNSRKLSQQVPFYDFGFEFRGSIAFTAFKECSRSGPPFLDDERKRLWPCDIPKDSNAPVGACISEDLFCDSTINCGIHDSHEFALDERFCKDVAFLQINDSNPVTITRVKGLELDVPHLEEAIHKRIFKNERPFGYNEMNIQWGHPIQTPHNPGIGHGGSKDKNDNDFFPIDTIPKDQASHPAFVALVILISIICVVVIGLMFRYCCKSCVGRMDPYGSSSNPDAVARFRENLSNRDASSNRISGGSYALSIDTLYKSSEDLPPSYEELFPQPLQPAVDPGDNRNKIQDNNISSSTQSSASNLTGMIFPTRRATSQSQRNSVSIPPGATPPIYTIPILAQQLQTTSHSYLDRSASAASTTSEMFSSEHNLDRCVINPAFVRVEVLPGPITLSSTENQQQQSSTSGGNQRLQIDLNMSDVDSRPGSGMEYL